MIIYYCIKFIYCITIIMMIFFCYYYYYMSRIHAFSQLSPSLAQISQEPWHLCAVSAESMKWGKMKQGWLVGFKFQWIDSRVFFWTHGFHPQSGFVSTFCPILNQIEQFENLKSLRIFITRRDKNLGVWLRPHTIGGLDFFKIGLVSIRVRSQVFKQFWKQNIFGTKESRNPDVDHFHGKPFEHTQQKQVGCFPFPHWWVHLLGDVFEIWNEQTQQTNIVLSTERSWKYVVRSNNYSIAIFCWSAFQIISACKHWFCFNFPWFKIWHACAEHVHLRKEQNLFPNGAIVLSEPPGKRITCLQHGDWLQVWKFNQNCLEGHVFFCCVANQSPRLDGTWVSKYISKLFVICMFLLLNWSCERWESVDGWSPTILNNRVIKGKLICPSRNWDINVGRAETASMGGFNCINESERNRNGSDFK